MLVTIKMNIIFVAELFVAIECYGTVLLELLLTICLCSYAIPSNEFISFGAWTMPPKLIICNSNFALLFITQYSNSLLTFMHLLAYT
jgi:hypothetical protein